MPSVAKSPYLVWYVDDDALTASDIITFWKSVWRDLAAPGARPVKFQHFSTAESAWAAFHNSREIPQVFVVDGHLDADEGEFREGAYFVRLVRSAVVPAVPALIGFSGDEYALQDMERVGAEATFAKGAVRSLIEYIERLSRQSN